MEESTKLNTAKEDRSDQLELLAVYQRETLSVRWELYFLIPQVLEIERHFAKVL
jgi:hypothetical protein